MLDPLEEAGMRRGYEDPPSPRSLRVRRLLSEGAPLRWTTTAREERIPISLNPLEQCHPCPYLGRRLDHQEAAGAVDEDVSRAGRLLPCPRGPGPSPLHPAAARLAYQDPYDGEGAETKVLAGKGVSFLLLARARPLASQLAKKLALEMNLVLIDPMQLLENYYQNATKGYFIPPYIYEDTKSYLNCNTSKDVKDTLVMLRSIVSYFYEQTKGLTEHLDSLRLPSLLNEEVETLFKKSCFENDLQKIKNLSEAFISDSRRSGDNTACPLEKSDEPKSKFSLRTLKSFDISSDAEVPSAMMSCFGKSTDFQKLVQELATLSPAEADKLLEVIIEDTSLASPHTVLPQGHKDLLCEGIAAKNFSHTKSVLTELVRREVESFDSFTRGYVLVYDPVTLETDPDLWPAVFASLNPPDLILFGQCPIDETKSTLEALRINPFIPYECYHSDFFNDISSYSKFFCKIQGLEMSEIIDYFKKIYKDKSVPIEESLILEYAEIMYRRNLLCGVSKVCKQINFSSGRRNIEEDVEGIGFSEGLPYMPIENPEELILQLDNYVKIPSVVYSLVAQMNANFNFDCLMINSALNFDPSCIIKIDMRTPLCYQFSAIKRWFDYSGFYSKPRARCGSLAKLSIYCEIIGKSIERDKMNNEFLLEYNSRTFAEDRVVLDEAQGEDEVVSNLSKFPDRMYRPRHGLGEFEETEEHVFDVSYKPPTVSSETISSLSEFESLYKSSQLDEFYYLRKGFEDKLTFISDLQELNSRDDPLFFRTYQCYLTVWDDRCPVAHHEGKCRRGSLDYVTRLHDKCYFMSSLQAMKAFMYQPARYLLPLLPASQCSVLVLGDEKYERTYLAEAVATFFGASVIDYDAVMNKAYEEMKYIYLENASPDLITLLNLVFCEELSASYKEECDKLVAWLDKAYQLVLFRKLIFKPLFWDIYPPELYNEPDDEMYSICEFYPHRGSKFDINRLCKRAQLKDIVMETFFETFQKYSDYMNIEPYFLNDCPEEVLQYDILLDTLLREQFKNLGLIDIYGSYDLCNLYAWYPYRLLERFPIDLIPKLGPVELEDSDRIKDQIGQFLFPLNTVPLSVKEKIDALGTEIIHIENKARLSNQTRYGGWVINGMPVNAKLLKGLQNAGIFPRNTIYLDDPDFNYDLFKKFHSHEVSRMADIEKNLACYTSAKLRKSVCPPFSMRALELQKDNIIELTNKPKETEDLSNFGMKVARASSKFKHFLSCRSSTFDDESSLGWRGEKGLRNHLGRDHMFVKITEHPEYDYLPDSKFKTLLDLYELLYMKYGRYYFKPLGSLAPIHSITASTLRPFLYDSEQFKSKKNLKNRIYKLIDCFVSLAKEDDYITECIKLVPFQFSNEKNTFSAFPISNPEIKTDLSYLYHLAYAIENSMSMSMDIDGIFKKIHVVLKDLGYSFGIQSDFQSKMIEVPHTTWEEKEKHRGFLHVEKRLRIHSEIINYEYIISKILELEKKKSEPGTDIICNLDENSDSRMRCPTSISRISTNEVNNMGITALTTVLEFDVSTVLSTDDDSPKYILYMPQNLPFLSNQEKAYDICLMTNRKYQSVQDISGKDFELNTLLLLRDENIWDDWNFSKDEDYGDLLNFWENKSNRNFIDLQKSFAEKFSQEKGFHFLKKVITIQERIEMLRQVNNKYSCSDEEHLLLNYLIWIRNEYFKRFSIGVPNLPEKLRPDELPKSNFPYWIPKFSNFFEKYLTDKNENNSKKNQINFGYEIWPFRSNYKNLPKFMGIYDCTLWEEIRQVRMKKQKVKINEPVQPGSSNILKSCKRVSSYEPELETDLVVQGFVNFLTDRMKLFSCDEFKERIIKLKHKKRNQFLFSKHTDFKNIMNKTGSPEAGKSGTNSECYSGIGRSEPDLLRLDGKEVPISRRNNKESSIEDVKDFILTSQVSSKVSWVSLDEFGPFNILYTVLNAILGSRGLPKVTGCTMPPEKENEIEVLDEGFATTKLIIEDEIKIRGDNEKLCIVSFFDGFLTYGLEELSVEILGKTYFFCSYECFTRFRLSPEKYLNLMEPCHNISPFNLFYLELPGGLGRNVCSLLSYYFKISTYYMDDFLVQRLRGKNSDNDIKAISLKKKLLTRFTSEFHKQLQDNENFLWSYLVQESEIPGLNSIIKKFWEKRNNFCLYNFPHHIKNLKEVVKKCFIPSMIIMSDFESLRKMMEYKNIDFIKYYAGDMYDDKNRISNMYLHDFKWWMSNWQKRFLKTLKLIKREELSQTITMLQFNLLVSQNKIKPRGYGQIVVPYNQFSLWSNSFFPCSDISGKNSSKSVSSENDIASPPVKLTKPLMRPKDRSQSTELPFPCDSKNDMPRILTGKQNDYPMNNTKKVESSSTMLKSSRFKLPYKNKWTCPLKSNFDYKDLKKIHDKRSFKKLCLNMKEKLQEEINKELEFRDKIKQTICSKKMFADDEANFKSEVLSVDSVSFEDYDNVPISKEDFTKDDSLRFLTVALKHTNTLNPIPVPILDKYYEYASTDDLSTFTKCQLQSFIASVGQLQTYFDGVNNLNFDILNDNIQSLFNKIKESKKQLVCSECVTEIDGEDVEKFLDTGYYFLSKYGRQCPVKSRMGFLYPQSTIMYDSSNCFPAVHRRYIYFLSSREALEIFKYSPLEFLDAAEYNPPIPIKAIFFGPNTKRTKYVIQKLANEYSLEEISVSKALEHAIRRGSWTKLGQRLKWQTSYIFGLPYPEKIPTTLLWQAILSLASSPKSTTHGFIISGLAPSPDLFQIWHQSKFKPHLIFYLTVDDTAKLIKEQQEEIMTNLYSAGLKNKKFQYMRNLYETNMFGCSSNEINAWETSSNSACIAYLQRCYSNVHVMNYEGNSFSMPYQMSSIILDLLKNIKLLNNIIINKNEEPLPVGKFISYNEFIQLSDKCWGNVCSVCVCTSGRYLRNDSEEFQPGVFLKQGKTYWVCQKHTSAFLSSSKEYTSTFGLKLYLSQGKPDTSLNQNKMIFSFSGFCPVCYWVQHPHLEYQYRCGSYSYLQFYNNEAFKFCSEFCLNEFISAPWLYAFLGQCKIESGMIPCIADTKYWNEFVMKNLDDNFIFIRDVKKIFFYNILRLAINLNMVYPGFSKREARIFFIYALAKRYMDKKGKANNWRVILLDFLQQCGISKKILKKFLHSNEKDMVLPELLEHFASNMTK